MLLLLLLLLMMMMVMMMNVCVCVFSTRSTADVGQTDSEPVFPGEQHHREDSSDGTRLAEHCM